MTSVPEHAEKLFKCEKCGRVIGGLDKDGDGWWSVTWEQCRHYTLNSARLDKRSGPLIASWTAAAKFIWRDSKNRYFAIPVI